jgi:hypothetical protein
LEPSFESPLEPPLYPVKKTHTFSKRKIQYIILLQRVRIQEPHAQLFPPKKEMLSDFSSSQWDSGVGLGGRSTFKKLTETTQA